MSIQNFEPSPVVSESIYVHDSADMTQHPMLTRWDFDPRDPFGVEVTFNLDTDYEVTWMIGRELLANAVEAAICKNVGEGDVVFRRDETSILHDEVQMTLSTPGRIPATLTLPRTPVYSFLELTQGLVMPGGPEYAIYDRQFDQEIDAFLAGPQR